MTYRNQPVYRRVCAMNVGEILAASSCVTVPCRQALPRRWKVTVSVRSSGGVNII